MLCDRSHPRCATLSSSEKDRCQQKPPGLTEVFARGRQDLNKLQRAECKGWATYTAQKVAAEHLVLVAKGLWGGCQAPLEPHPILHSH
jgi:hypothetical protein